jgi:hypothetical protein
MPRKKKKQPAKQPGLVHWQVDRDIPTYDFLDGISHNTWGLQEAVENFISKLEKGDFLTWEAVVGHEQGLALTAKQEKALDGLINFGDPDDDQILYINEIPRPSEPWYVILNKIVPHLLMEPFRTFDVHDDVKSDGWHRIMTALNPYGQGLSLPPGVVSHKEVVPAELRHKLWLQYCFEILSGLGQADDLILEEDDPWRVDEFIDRLRECKESVAFFGLTLESLLTRIILPERDRPLFVRLMQEKLGLKTDQERIADYL